MRVALIHPPDGIIPTVPCTSIPVLAGVLKNHGHEVLAYDAGLAVARETLRRDCIEHWYDLLEAEAARLTELSERTEEEAQELKRLQRLLAVPRAFLAEIDDARDVMRDARRFLDPAAFRRAFDVVRAAFRFAYSVSPDGYFDGRRVGHDVLGEPTPGLPDPPIEVFHRLVDRILADRPDVIGLTVPFDSAIFFGLKLARLFKQRAPHIPVVMGGAAIESNSYPVTSDPFFYQVLDFVMVGEGEVQFPRFLDALAKGEDPRQVNNLRWLAEDGTIGRTEMVLVSDLNAVPAPDFTVLDYEGYLLPDPVATLQTSRGCYYGKCTFCSELFRKGFRIRRPDLVVEDMVQIHRQTGIRHFQLWDSLAPPKTLKKIAQEVKARGLDFEWMAETKFERPYKDEEMIRTLAEGGCRFLQFGFESGSSRVLDLIDKGNDLDDVDQTLTHMEKHGIRAGMTWFIGFPGETEREADITHDFVATRRDVVMFSSYTRTFDIGTDTIVFEQQERFGIEVFEVSDGVLSYRHKDGTERWDTEERDQAFWARGDFYLLMNNIELHYSKLPLETALQISGQHRCGPLLRQIDPEAVHTARFVASDDLHLRHYGLNPLDPAKGAYAVAVHPITGASFDLNAEALALLGALERPLTFHELAAASGLDPQRAHKLLDQAVNRGLVRILVDDRHVTWIPEAMRQQKVLA